MPNYSIFDFCGVIFHCSIEQTKENRWEKFSVCSIRQFCLFAFCGTFICFYTFFFIWLKPTHSLYRKLASVLTPYLFVSVLFSCHFNYSPENVSLLTDNVCTMAGQWSVLMANVSSACLWSACLACFAYYPVSACPVWRCLPRAASLGRSDVKETKSFSQTVAKSNVWTPPTVLTSL